MATGGNFYDELTLNTNLDKTTWVEAGGPVYDGTLREISVFVAQPEKGGPNDAVAAKSTLAPGSGGLDLSAPGEWRMRADQRTGTVLSYGKAFAMAIAVFMNKSGEEKVRLWAQSVDLVAPKPESQTSSTDEDDD